MVARPWDTYAMARKNHSCTKTEAREHRIARLANREEVIAHAGRSPERLMTGHALCGGCFKPVSVCRMGRYHHVSAKGETG